MIEEWRLWRLRVWVSRLSGHEAKLALFESAPWSGFSASTTTDDIESNLRRKVAHARYKVEVISKMMGLHITAPLPEARDVSPRPLIEGDES